MISVFSHRNRRRVLAAYGIVLGLALTVGWIMWRNHSAASLTWSDAIETGDVRMAAAIASAGADPEEPRVLGMTPLMRAAIRDESKIVEVLVAAGADVNAMTTEGIQALHAAAQVDSPASARVLIDAGADPVNRSLNGMNALDHAAVSGSVEMIRLLAAAGVDLDANSDVVTQGHGYPRDRGATPLGLAARAGEVEAIEALLDLGADINALSASGHSALLLAVFGNQPDAVISLLENGADPLVVASCLEACSFPSGDALHWARLLDRTDSIPVLEGVAPKS